MKRNWKRRGICLTAGAILTLSLSLPAPAMNFADLAQAAQDYLPSVAEKLGVELDYDLVESAVTELLDSEWFKNATIDEKIDKISVVLESLGIAEADIAADKLRSIMSFEFGGQEIGIFLDDYSKELFAEMVPGYPETEDAAARQIDKDALILYGLGYPEFESSLEVYADNWSSQGLHTEMLSDCTVEDFRTRLQDYDLIVIEEHGNYDWMGTPMIITEEQRTEENAARYQEDLAAGRVYSVICDKGTIYFIHPSFFPYYYGGEKLKDTAVWIGSCSGNRSSDLSTAFRNCGAAAVLGHSNEVYTAYDNSMLNTMVSGMIGGENMSAALAEAKQKWGENDNIYAEQFINIPSSQIKEEASYPCLSGDARW